MSKKKSKHNNHNKQDRSIEAQVHEAGFRGYNYDEIRYQLMVNRLKIEITRDKLAMLASPRMQQNANHLSGYVSGVSTFLRYFDIAMVGYTIIKKVASVVRFFLPHRQSQTFNK